MPVPAVNAGFNGLAAVFLTLAYYFIKQGRVRAHRACMLAAVAASTLFLIGYVIYHLDAGVTRFAGSGAERAAYLTLLATHTVLAAFVPPLALWTLALGLKGRWQTHARVARWTLPIWMYVSVTGVAIYLWLYKPWA